MGFLKAMFQRWGVKEAKKEGRVAPLTPHSRFRSLISCGLASVGERGRPFFSLGLAMSRTHNSLDAEDEDTWLNF